MNPFREYPITKIYPLLEADNLLPSIIFRSARKQCDQDLMALIGNRKAQASQQERATLEVAIQNAIEKHKIPSDVIFTHPHYEPLLKTCVGAHHAGQLLPWRLLLEELMSRGHLKMLLATGTVAAGVDFPARSVVVTAHSRRDNEGFRAISPSELQQMSGRAGRRGKDKVGFCLVAPGQYSDARIIEQVSKFPPEPLKSAYFAAPSTVLNLLKYRNVDDLRFTVSRSLASFLDKKTSEKLLDEAEMEHHTVASQDNLSPDARRRLERKGRRKKAEAESLAERQSWQLEQTLHGLHDLGYLEGSSLSKKGHWAAELCTSLVLELSETIDAGIVIGRPMHEFIGLIASIAGDPHRHYISIKKNPIQKSDFQAIEKLITRVRNSYQNPSASGVVVQPDAAATVLTWIESSTWVEFSSLLRLSGVAEGDVARLITQTADHLNQITKLKGTHPELAEQASEARMLIMKPPFTDPELG